MRVREFISNFFFIGRPLDTRWPKKETEGEKGNSGTGERPQAGGKSRENKGENLAREAGRRPSSASRRYAGALVGSLYFGPFFFDYCNSASLREGGQAEGDSGDGQACSRTWRRPIL